MGDTRATRDWVVPLLAIALIGVAALAVPGRVIASGRTAPLRLSDAVGRVEAWPAIGVLVDRERRLTADDAARVLDTFTTPRTGYATLGVITDPVWLHVPVHVDQASTGDWILDIDYAPLVSIDVYLLRDGRVVQQVALGTSRPFETRPLQSRTHSTPLALTPGASHDLLIRAETTGTLILPITFNTPTVFHATALGEQMLQGVLAGIGVCLLLYSIAQWLVLREPFFLKYCVLISGSLLFSLLQFGIGMQFLWTNNLSMERHAGGTSALIALVGSFLFIEQALEDSRSSAWFSRLMKGGAIFCAAIAALYAFDGLADTTVTAIVSVLGPVPVLLGMPGAIRRVRRGDPIGGVLLIAWFVYFVTTAMLIGVIGGRLPATFWTLHSFQFGATVDMVAFTYVLGLRTKAIRQVAQRASVERDMMRSLAITDPLTGLANRRGLSHVFIDAGRRTEPGGVLALFLIDVDGFKAVNDRHGHDVGDELLVQIGSRLSAAVRNTDIVARLGGDEFVVVADGLSSPTLAEDLGQTLVALGDEPFALTRHTVHISLTVGYAISPPAERDPARLLQMADGAMYEGKRAGKRCLRRGDATMATSASIVDASVF